MAELPTVRQATCGHWVPADAEPTAQMVDAAGGTTIALTLCPACLPALPAFTQAPLVIRKDLDGPPPKRKYVRKAR